MVFIDVPTNVIANRIAGRRICPICNTSRNLLLLPTNQVGYDPTQKNFIYFATIPNVPAIIKLK